VIHQIKALYNQGQGLSIRKIADQLEISRNTVSKYLKLDETEIAALQQRGTKRKKNWMIIETTLSICYKAIPVYRLSRYSASSRLKPLI